MIPVECRYCNSVAGGSWKSPHFMPEVPPYGMFWHANAANDITMPCARLNAVLHEFGDLGIRTVSSMKGKEWGERMDMLLVLARKVQGMMNAEEIPSAIEELRKFALSIEIDNSAD